MGISYNQSSKWQKLADIPEEDRKGERWQSHRKQSTREKEPVHQRYQFPKNHKGKDTSGDPLRLPPEKDQHQEEPRNRPTRPRHLRRFLKEVIEGDGEAKRPAFKW